MVQSSPEINQTEIMIKQRDSVQAYAHRKKKRRRKKKLATISDKV
jgi:hypothetical protein